METGEALYAARLLRHIDYPVDPGVIILCFNEQLMKDILSDPVEKGVKRAIMTSDGQVCWQNTDEKLTTAEIETCKRNVQDSNADARVSGELYLLKEEKNSGLWIATVIPDAVMSGGMSVIRILKSSLQSPVSEHICSACISPGS